MGAIGCFILPGNYHDVAQVADSHSPTFIRNQDYRLKVDKKRAERANVKCCSPDLNKDRVTFLESAVQILAK
jgi:hypothetical protein